MTRKKLTDEKHSGWKGDRNVDAVRLRNFVRKSSWYRDTGKKRFEFSRVSRVDGIGPLLRRAKDWSKAEPCHGSMPELHPRMSPEWRLAYSSSLLHWCFWTSYHMQRSKQTPARPRNGVSHQGWPDRARSHPSIFTVCHRKEPPRYESVALHLCYLVTADYFCGIDVEAGTDGVCSIRRVETARTALRKSLLVLRQSRESSNGAHSTPVCCASNVREQCA